jgi:hypothetical protein
LANAAWFAVGGVSWGYVLEEDRWEWCEEEAGLVAFDLVLAGCPDEEEGKAAWPFVDWLRTTVGSVDDAVVDILTGDGLQLL